MKANIYKNIYYFVYNLLIDRFDMQNFFKEKYNLSFPEKQNITLSNKELKDIFNNFKTEFKFDLLNTNFFHKQESLGLNPNWIDILVVKNIKKYIEEAMLKYGDNIKEKNLIILYTMLYICEIKLQKAWWFITKETKVDWNYFSFWELPFSWQPVWDNREALWTWYFTFADNKNFNYNLYNKLKDISLKNYFI